MFNLTIELPKLKVFKSNKLAEEKIIQKAAKKSRQKQHWHQSLQHQKFPTPFSTQKYGGSQEIHTEAAERGDCVLMIVQYWGYFQQRILSIGFKVEASEQNLDQNFNIPNLNQNSHDTPLNSNDDWEHPENELDMTKAEFDKLLN